MAMSRWLAACLVLTCAGAGGAWAASALPIDETTPVRVDDQTTRYTYEADEPGVLTVVVWTPQLTDVRLSVRDEYEQAVVGGDAWAERKGRVQTAAILPTAGRYVIDLGAFEPTDVDFRASWMPLPELGDEDANASSTPAGAVTLRPGQRQAGTLRPQRNVLRNWYVVEAAEAGQLAVFTRGRQGDLVLEAFAEGQFAEPLVYSDMDAGGNLAHESLVVDVVAGQRLFVRVSTYDQQNASDYFLHAYLITPDAMQQQVAAGAAASADEAE